MNEFWKKVTEKDVSEAIKRFDSSQKPYPEARNTFLIFNDKKYPAKHIRGISYSVANEIEISKQDYSGGKETANFFVKRGFTVEYRGEILKP